MDTAWFAAAFGFALASSATPGPNNTMVMASAAAWGWRRTVPHMLGIAIGFPVMVLAVGLGAAGVFRAAPWLHDVLRLVGAAYMLWLAWKIATADPGDDAAPPRGRPIGFVQAAGFQWVNPKAWTMALTAVVAFTTEAGVLAQSLALAGLFFLASLPSNGLWLLVGLGAARLLRGRRARIWFNRAMAGLLVLSLAGLLL